MPTKTVPLMPLPAGVGVLNAGLRDAQRGAVAKALALNAEPVLRDEGDLARATLHIPPALHDKVEEMAKARGISFQKVWVGLVRAGFAAMSAETASMTYRIESADPPPFAVRAGEAGRLQEQYWRSVISPLRQGRIVVAEGSTGLGKGRVLVAAALEQALAGVKPVAVAAPTLKVLAQLWSEYEELIKQEPSRWAGLRVRFLPGTTEFVDPLKVQNYLQEVQAEAQADEKEGAVDAAVQSWYEQGGKPLQNSPLARALALSGEAGHNGQPVAFNFLADDLRAIATEVEPQSLLLDYESGKTDPRVLAAKEQATGAHVVFCTHAMIAWQHKAGWAAWESPPKCLILDEAHEFERAVAQANTRAVALRAVRRGVAKSMTENQITKTAAREARNALINLEGECARLFDEGDGNSHILLYNAPQSLTMSLERLRDVLASKAFQRLPRIELIRKDLGEVARALQAPQQNGRGPMISWVDYSPKRAFPSLVAGEQNLGGILGSLWKTATHGVVLASATLKATDAGGALRANYLASILALPHKRTDVPNSVTLPAIYKIPVLHLPSKGDLPAITRPERAVRNEDSERAWLRNLSVALERIVSRPSIKGGTLVLMTSLSQAKDVAAHLCSAIGSDRVIAAEEGARIAQLQSRFIERYRDGVKPVLVGVGAAWTGLDLSDKTVSAEKDFLLTDLIIGCLPVGLNRTATMMARIDRTGTNAIEKEALMMLRQGLGRLIRREGVTDRHIWFLDGRLWTDWKGMEGLTSAGRKILQDYKTRKGLSVA